MFDTPEKNFSIYELVKWGDNYLRASGIENSFGESMLLMGFVVGLKSEGIILSWHKHIDAPASDLFVILIKRRAAKEPYAYIVNSKEFYSIDFYVDSSVLIPRPDTECLIDESIAEIEKFKQFSIDKIKILDLGTGSGAIAISIAKNSDNVIIYAADNSLKALETAKKNACLNGVLDKVLPVYFDMANINDISDIFEKSKGNSAFPIISAIDIDGFDIIVSNPPYIESGELNTLDEGVRFYEPVSALDGGRDGMDFYRKILNLVVYGGRKEKHKVLILEIDYRKKEAIYSIFRKGFDDNNITLKSFSYINDLSGRERAVKITYG